MERNYNHPYTPYAIQLEFMSSLYELLDQGQRVGIFESPTGTGKSLSLICSSLTWLRDAEWKEILHDAVSQDDDEPAWVVEQAKAERIRRVTTAKRELDKRLAKIRSEEARRRQMYEQGQPLKKKSKRDRDDTTATSDRDADFLLDDYDDSIQHVRSNQDGLSDKTLKLLDSAGMIAKSEAEDDPYHTHLQIFFCSRTHSQLSQFASEVRRVTVQAIDPLSEKTDTQRSDSDKSSGQARLLPLGSRKNLCINPKVTKLGNVTAINERCLELQQSKTPKEHKCKFLPNKDNEPLVTQFRDLAMAKIRDIEDLAEVGKETGICPYYASRSAVRTSEIVTLPYPLLLQKSAREALNIDLRGQVVVVDEAHNLIDAILSMDSVAVSLNQLQQSRDQLTEYLRRFKNKLKGLNRVYVAQTLRLIQGLESYLKEMRDYLRRDGGIVDMQELSTSKNLDQIDMPKLMRYLQESKLARKVAGYAAFERSNSSDDSKLGVDNRTSETPALMKVESLFRAMTNPASEGLFHWDFNDGSYWLKFTLLDPLDSFRQVVDAARVVILAGGTMSPMDEFDKRLFPHIDTKDIRHFSCSHVIPRENLLFNIVRGVGHVPFRFTFEKRSSSDLLIALGRVLCDMARAIPDGFVIFFASYQYLDEVFRVWSTMPRGGLKSTVLSQLEKIKPIFQERKDVNADSLLRDYSKSIHSGRGGLLLSVIGGKLSEGINFSDALGRGVAVVGLPVPNIKSIEWSFKLDYTRQQVRKRGGSEAEANNEARELIMNVTMRAVNQSIGRAIRHRRDYAHIALLDERYHEPAWNQRLPQWIRDGLRLTDLKTGEIQEFFQMSHDS